MQPTRSQAALNNSYMHKQKYHVHHLPLSSSQGTVVSHFQQCMPQWASRSPALRSTSPLCQSPPASLRWRDSPPRKTASTCRTTGVSIRCCTYTIRRAMCCKDLDTVFSYAPLCCFVFWKIRDRIFRKKLIIPVSKKKTHCLPSSSSCVCVFLVSASSVSD